MMDMCRDGYVIREIMWYLLLDTMCVYIAGSSLSMLLMILPGWPYSEPIMLKPPPPYPRVQPL